MKPDIHPNYRPVVFQDLSSDFAFLTRSTMPNSMVGLMLATIGPRFSVRCSVLPAHSTPNMIAAE